MRQVRGIGAAFLAQAMLAFWLLACALCIPAAASWAGQEASPAPTARTAAAFNQALAQAMSQAQPHMNATLESLAAMLDESAAHARVAALMSTPLSPADMDRIPGGVELQWFSLRTDDAATLAIEPPEDVRSAIDEVETFGDVGMVFFNAATGVGLAYNADLRIYSASSFKGPYAVYVCQGLVEPGDATLDDDVPTWTYGGIPIDPESAYARTGGTWPARDLIEAAVVESDNDAFGMLRNYYDEDGYDDWASDLHVYDAPASMEGWYPTYSARSAAKLWLNARDYLQTDTPTSRWLGGLFASTNVSFIRDGLNGTGAQVLNKAGWINDWEWGLYSVVDAGIITCEGQTYVMCIMVEAPDSIEAEDAVGKLAKALFDARVAIDELTLPDGR